MTIVTFLTIVRILAYAGMACYALWQRRWWVWLAFTVLTASTYIYGFSNFSALNIELVRTTAGALLIYVTLRRL